MRNFKIAIPSDNPGGMGASVSGHFGHCALYTVVVVDENEIKNISTMDNPPHQEGGCLAPVQLLAQQGVNILLAGGMGQRPLSAFQQVGIEVYLATGYPTVEQAVSAFLEEKLPRFSMDSVCGGCGGH